MIYNRLDSLNHYPFLNECKIALFIHPYLHLLDSYLPVPYVQVYCCSIAPAQSQSEHDDASEMVGDHECSATFSWQALPGRVSSAPALHSSLSLHL